MLKKFRKWAEQRNRIPAFGWMLFLAGVLVMGLRFSYEREAWLDIHIGITDCIEDLKNRVPPETDQRAWASAVGRCTAGFWNACHSPDDTTLSELKILRIDIEKLIAKEPVSSAMLWNIWNRIGETNGHASRYIRTCEPDFRDFMQPVESSTATSPEQQ